MMIQSASGTLGRVPALVTRFYTPAVHACTQLSVQELCRAHAICIRVFTQIQLVQIRIRFQLSSSRISVSSPNPSVPLPATPLFVHAYATAPRSHSACPCAIHDTDAKRTRLRRACQAGVCARTLKQLCLCVLLLARLVANPLIFVDWDRILQGGCRYQGGPLRTCRGRGHTI